MIDMLHIMIAGPEADQKQFIDIKSFVSTFLFVVVFWLSLRDNISKWVLLTSIFLFLPSGTQEVW